jgi:hypothetical protein
MKGFYMDILPLFFYDSASYRPCLLHLAEGQDLFAIFNPRLQLALSSQSKTTLQAWLP